MTLTVTFFPLFAECCSRGMQRSACRRGACHAPFAERHICSPAAAAFCINTKKKVGAEASVPLLPGGPFFTFELFFFFATSAMTLATVRTSVRLSVGVLLSFCACPLSPRSASDGHRPGSQSRGRQASSSNNSGDTHTDLP